MSADLQTIIDDFEFLDDWEDRYRYVIELGRALPPYPEQARTADNKVNGCVSQVWLNTTINDAGGERVLSFEGDSDAHIVRGLVAIMIAAMSGQPASAIQTMDIEALMGQLGLDEHLSPQRSNGLRSMVERMKRDAAAAA
ncbi:MAG: SufE family protein [Ahrensia sp.]